MTDEEILADIARMSQALGDAKALLRRVVDTEPTPSLRDEILRYLQDTG